MNSISTINFYLDRPGVIKIDDGNTLIIKSPDQLIAEGLIKAAQHLAHFISRLGKEKAIIRHPDDGGDGFPIYRWYADLNLDLENNSMIQSSSGSGSTANPNLPRPARAAINVNSSHDELLLFLGQASADGYVVMIADMKKSAIRYVNDNVPYERVLCLPGEMCDQQIFNNNDFWRDSLDDKRELYRLLKEDGFIPGFEHRLRRKDGSMARYAHDFYLIQLGGVPARLVVSRPNDYEVIPEESLVR